MLTAEAVIQTDHADRYLARLGQHTGKMGRQPGHRPRRHGGGEPPEVQHAEWSGTQGTVRLNLGRWTIRAAPGGLTLHAEAADQASLQQIQDMLTTRLEKLGWREHLTVSWQPHAAPAEPGQPA
jgi:hypothetical protein